MFWHIHLEFHFLQANTRGRGQGVQAEFCFHSATGKAKRRKPGREREHTLAGPTTSLWVVDSTKTRALGTEDEKVPPLSFLLFVPLEVGWGQ